MRVELPYGETRLLVELERAKILESQETPVIKDVERELLKKLENPILSPRFDKMLRDSKRILLIIPDNTRAFPSKLIIPILLEKIREANPKAETRILVATGLHAKVSYQELQKILGKEILEEYEVVNHRASDESWISKRDKWTSYGTPLQVNKMILESDTVIGAGLIEPHFFAGYSGGRKILLPGVAGRDAIFNNHGFKMISNPNSRAGVLNGNPIHEDMVEFMKNAKLDFILNVTIDKNRRITGIFAGDPLEAHFRGVNFLDQHVKVAVKDAADIVITTNGGYPLDRDIYQAVKGMDAAASAVRDGGVIIIASECRDGLGGHEEFLKLVKGADSPEEILERIRRSKPLYDQWEAQILARILRRARVILVSDFISEKTAQDLLLEHAKDIEEALELARNILGEKSGRILAIPEGPYVVPTFSSSD